MRGYIGGYGAELSWTTTKKQKPVHDTVREFKMAGQSYGDEWKFGQGAIICRFASSELKNRLIM